MSERKQRVSPYQEHDCWQRRVKGEVDIARRMQRSVHLPSHHHPQTEPFTRLRKRKGISFSADLHELLVNNVNSKQGSPDRQVPLRNSVQVQSSRGPLELDGHIPSTKHSPYFSQFAAAHYLKPNQREPEAPEHSWVLQAIRLDPLLSAVDKNRREQSYLRRAREQIAL